MPPRGYTKCDPEEVRLALQQHRSLASAARALGIDRATLGAYCRRWPGLRLPLDARHEALLDRAEAVIEQALERNDVRVAMFVVQQLGARRGWGNGQTPSAAPTRIRLTWADGRPVPDPEPHDRASA